MELLETEIAKLSLQLEMAEKYLIFYGLTKCKSETTNKLIEAIKLTLEQHLQTVINPTEIGNIFKLGRKSEGKPRPVLITFLSK